MKHIPKSLASKSFPSFIRNHEVVTSSLLQQDCNSKIFPKIGLKNSSSPFKLSTAQGIEIILKDYAKELATQFESAFSYTFNVSSVGLIECAQNSSIRVVNNKIQVIATPNTKLMGFSGNNSNFFNWIKSIYYRANRSGNRTHVIDMSVDEANKRIKSLQSSTDDLKISFSSSGPKGAWDLATMSMRGIASCQRWTNNYSKSLIGSIADPYAGIIFISKNEETKYGLKMIKRAVVRLVKNINTNQLCLLVERIYPHNYDISQRDTITFSIFANYLAKKTKNKFPIVYGQEILETKTNHSYIIPTFSNIARMQEYELSYRDSKVIYGALSDLNLINNL